MSESTSHPDLSEFAFIEDSGVRRAIRALHQHVNDTLLRQQMEIDALLELMLEKHVTSLSEFKRQLVRLQQDTTRGSRIRGAMAAPPHAGPGPGMPH